MSALRESFTSVPIDGLCSLFGYTKQAYYQSVHRRTQEVLRDSLVLDLVCEYCSQMGQLGGRKLHHLVNARLPDDLRIGRDSFFTLLGTHGYLLRRHRYRPRTTNSYHHFHRYPNLIRDFVPESAHQLYVSDITYISVDEDHFYYLSLITDAYSRKIMGWALMDTLEMNGPVLALQMALAQTPSTARLIHHSDRGVQYCSHKYVNTLLDAPLAEIRISMTESGDPLENAIAERTNGILKMEWINQMKFESLEDARTKIGAIIHIYNSERPHLSLNMLTPDQAHQNSGPIKRRWKNYYKNKKNEQL